MRTATVLLLSAAMMTLSGCFMANMGKRSSPPSAPTNAADGSGAPAGAAADTPAPEAARTPRLAAVPTRKVVHIGTFAVVVGDVVYAMDRTKALAEEMGGYLQRMSGSTITIRVPAENFYQAVTRLDQIGTVASRDITAQDVTEQYFDLKIRLKNAKVMAERLRKLVAQAIDIKAALLVEQELTRVVTEIERLERQLKSLESRVAYGTLTVTFQRLRHAATLTLKVKLPFAWLHGLGLDNLLSF